jgi:hypothetical protein
MYIYTYAGDVFLVTLWPLVTLHETTADNNERHAVHSNSGATPNLAVVFEANMMNFVVNVSCASRHKTMCIVSDQSLMV